MAISFDDGMAFVQAYDDDICWLSEEQQAPGKVQQNVAKRANKSGIKTFQT